MKPRAEQQAEESELPASPATPPGYLPSFARIKKLPLEERHASLSAWVIWTNANRGRMDPDLERRLDDTLRDLDASEVDSADVDRPDRGVDEWLDGLDQVPRVPT